MDDAPPPVNKDRGSNKSPVIFYLMEGHFQIKTFEQASYLAEFLAEICPHKMLAQMGLCELFQNAIEHGNLGITADEKKILQKEGRWLEEINHRLNLPEYKQKIVNVYSEYIDHKLKVKVIDQGLGFDWKKYGKKCLEDNKAYHGRGILMATKLAFSSIEYAGLGNEVIGTINLS